MYIYAWLDALIFTMCYPWLLDFYIFPPLFTNSSRNIRYAPRLDTYIYTRNSWWNILNIYLSNAACNWVGPEHFHKQIRYLWLKIFFLINIWTFWQLTAFFKFYQFGLTNSVHIYMHFYVSKHGCFVLN